MSGIGRVDRIIGIALVVVLAGLVGLGVSDNSPAASPAVAHPLSAPAAATSATPTPTGTVAPDPTAAATTTTAPTT